MVYEQAVNTIEERRELLEAAARKIWENPEGPNQEFIAAELCANILRDAGFEVQLGCYGLETAIRAQYGTSGPVIGFLGEYDALPGMSQKVSAVREPVTPGAYGQACGHNLLGIAHLGAALGLQQELIKNKLAGTVVFYGCPAEEALLGKGVMAREGAFCELDAALVFHPSRFNGAMMNVYNGVRSVKFHFRGRSAHAAADPYNGRSALDAVELTNVGANYLREHLPPEVRMHYIITEGGTAPNVVPDRASVWYNLRARTQGGIQQAYERLCDVAKGAALMTGTQVTPEILGGCYPTAFNSVLAQVLDETLREIPPEPWAPEELEFAAALNETEPEQWEAACKKYECPPGTQLYEGVLKYSNGVTFGSTDVGDVCHIVPTGWIYTACYNVGAPGHSWQVTACAGSSIGEKGMLYAAKTLAAAGAKLLRNPELLKRAKAEFNEKIGPGAYTSPIPPKGFEA